MKKYAVIGNPAGHSRSPAVFNSLFDRYGMDCRYVAVSVSKAGDIPGIIEKYGFSGVNITAPFKEEVFQYLSHADNISKYVGAVNTVVYHNGSLSGFNTDVYGVESSLINNGIDVTGENCLVLGAGGAARAAAYAVKQLGGIPCLCNRTDGKAEKASSEIGCSFIKFNELPGKADEFRIVISTVPELPESIKTTVGDKVLFEADYRSETRLSSRRYISGEEWLINQAVKSFEHFFDKIPDIRIMKSAFSNITPKKNIAIVGPALSGKTTYGKITADRLGMKFIDTDETVEKASVKPIREIFSSFGETEFRRLEEKALEEAASSENAVISVGAGALSSAKNRKILESSCYTVLLDIDNKVLLSRMNMQEINKRPKLINGDPEETIKNMFESRKNDYISCADLIVQITEGLAESCAEKIIRELDAAKHFYK